MIKTVSLFISVCFLCGSSVAQTRIWRTVDGTIYEGTFEKTLFDKAYIRNAEGIFLKIPMEELSPPDLEYLFHNVPPEVSIDVRKKDRQQPLLEWSIPDDRTTLHTCKVRLTKTSNLPSQVKLTAELFIFGEEVDGENYVLVHRQQFVFVFPNEKKCVYEFEAVDIPFRHYYANWASQGGAEKYRGVTYLGYLVAVFDPQGNLIASDTSLRSQKWLSEDVATSVEKLNELYINGRGSAFSRHFDTKFRKRTVPRMPWHERSNTF